MLNTALDCCAGIDIGLNPTTILVANSKLLIFGMIKLGDPLFSERLSSFLYVTSPAKLFSDSN